MVFTQRIDWDSLDFIITGCILLLLGLLIRFLVKKIKNRKQRIITIIAIIILFLLVWTELGVGVFGTPFAGD